MQTAFLGTKNEGLLFKMVPRVEFLENTSLSLSCAWIKTEVFEYNEVIDQVQSIPVCALPNEKSRW